MNDRKELVGLNVLEVAAIIPKSLTHWPGRQSSVILVPGCNFGCSFCYNHSIIKGLKKLARIPEQKVFDFLYNESLENVVISGGEPLTQGIALLDFVEELKASGFKVKLETNGSNSEIIQVLLEERMLDSISLDLKNRLNEYAYFKIIGKRVSIFEIARSILLVKNSFTDYEFSFTFVPGLHSVKDVIETARAVKGSNRFVLQQFRKEFGTLRKECEKLREPSYDQLLKIAKQIKGIEEVRIRTRKGDEIIRLKSQRPVREIKL